MKRVTTTIVVLILVASLSAWAGAAEPAWPQFRGPNHDGISPETGLFSALDQNGPKVLWTAAVGTGYSSVSIANGLAYTLGNTHETDAVFCFDALTGKEVWRHSYPSRKNGCNSKWDLGPIATPTVAGAVVYTLDCNGQAFCLDAKTGKVVWNIRPGGGMPQHGYGGSPLVDGPQVIFNTIGGGAAVDAASGKVLWKGNSGNHHLAGCSTPVAFTTGGTRRLLLYTMDTLVAVNPATGQPAWEYPWKNGNGNINNPVVIGDKIFVSARDGCALLSVTGSAPTVVWENKALRDGIHTSVYFDGHIYGLDAREGPPGGKRDLKCLDAKTGTVNWTQGDFGWDTLIIADGKLVILTYTGELVIANASPAAYKEISRTKVLDGNCLTPPSLCAGKIYCRDGAGNLLCLTMQRN